MKSGLYFIEVVSEILRGNKPTVPDFVTLMSDTSLHIVRVSPSVPVQDGGVATLNGFIFSTNEKGEISHVTRLPDEAGLKEQERIFFALCYNLRNTHKPREIVKLLNDTIPHKRCWYYLAKWSRLGFYDYGVTLDLGWFYPDDLPTRYLEIIKE